MIFALADWLRYRLCLGQYSDDPSKNILALGHTYRVAEETLKVIEPGDIIICQRMNSLLSWAIMYFGGRYAVDHVGIYIGEGKVLHLTLLGVKRHSIHSLARGARILPFRPYERDKTAAEFQSPQPSVVENNSDALVREALSDKAIAESYEKVAVKPHLQLLLRGIRIVLGLEPTSFSWKYYFDLGLVAASLDLLLWPLNQFPMVCTLWGTWLLVLIRLRILFHVQLRSGQKFKRDSHPGLVILLMRDYGGYIFPSGPVNGHWKIKVSPVWAAPSSQRQRAHRSPSQQSDQENSASDQ